MFYVLYSIAGLAILLGAGCGDIADRGCYSDRAEQRVAGKRIKREADIKLDIASLLFFDEPF